MRGRFITFEGGEGSGKSTQARLLSIALHKHGIATILTREPGGSPMGERIRSLLLDPAAKLDPVTQLFLFNAARHDHVVALIEPALSSGTWVLCDRFADSSRAYQGAAGQIPAETIRRFEKEAVGATWPDLTIILDIAPKLGLERARSRLSTGTNADAFESSDLNFHQKVRSGFLKIAKLQPERCVVLDAEQPEAALHATIWETCTTRLSVIKTSRSND